MPDIDPARQDQLLARIEAHARPLAGLLERLAREPGINRAALDAATCALHRSLLLAGEAVSVTPEPEPPPLDTPTHPFDRPEVAALLAAWINSESLP